MKERSLVIKKVVKYGTKEIKPFKKVSQFIKAKPKPIHERNLPIN